MRVSLGFCIALALVACREDAPAPQPSEAVEAQALPLPGPVAPATENPNETELESLLGIWRVTGVVPGAGAKFEADDRRIVGALMDVFPERLAWSHSLGDGFAPDDLCLGPVSGIIAHPEIAEEARAALAPALRQAGVEGGHRSRPHQWLCGDGGSWGDQAEFQTIGRDRMAMRWPGDLTLVLERVRRAASDPPPLPPTGAFE